MEALETGDRQTQVRNDSLTFDSARKKKLIQEAQEVLFKNRRVTSGHQYTVPSPTSYPYQWLWDSCFHAIALSHYDVEAAKREIRSLFARQFEDGMLPHMIYWEQKEGVIDVKWGREGTSSITQPPLVAEVVWMLYERDRDKEFLKACYSHLYHFYNYLLSERDPRRHHLAGILNPDESGEDNSPRFDKLLGLPPKHEMDENFKKRLILVEKLQTCGFDAPFCMKYFFWVKDVPFNAVLVRSLDSLAKISKEIGYEEEGLLFANQSLRVTQAMRDRMMEDGLFWSTMGENYEKLKVKTWAMFSPLYAKLLSAEEARSLVDEHLANPHEFKAPYSIPTVSLDEESFDPESMWRGPTWMTINWFVFRGLMNYGFTRDAQEVLNTTADLLEKSGFREFYHPQTGAGQGAKDFTWGTLIIDMLADVQS